MIKPLHLPKITGSMTLENVHDIVLRVTDYFKRLSDDATGSVASSVTQRKRVLYARKAVNTLSSYFDLYPELYSDEWISLYNKFAGQILKKGYSARRISKFPDKQSAYEVHLLAQQYRDALERTFNSSIDRIEQRFIFNKKVLDDLAKKQLSTTKPRIVLPKVSELGIKATRQDPTAWKHRRELILGGDKVTNRGLEGEYEFMDKKIEYKIDETLNSSKASAVKARYIKGTSTANQISILTREGLIAGENFKIIHGDLLELLDKEFPSGKVPFYRTIEDKTGKLRTIEYNLDLGEYAKGWQRYNRSTNEFSSKLAVFNHVGVRYVRIANRHGGAHKCPICSAYIGHVYAMPGVTKGTKKYPVLPVSLPMHINCKCYLVSVEL